MKQILLFAPIFLLSLIAYGQCPTTPIELQTQEDVDNFASNYPGCTEINVNLIISGADIVNLNGLSQITRCTQTLEIVNTNIQDLQGLNQLETIDFYVNISGNNNLTSLDGLDALETLGFGQIGGNTNLTTLDGFGSISTLLIPGEGLVIINNPSLTTLSGLSTFTASTALTIDNNDTLTSLDGLQNFNSFDSLYIVNNQNLNDLTDAELVPLNSSSLLIVRDNPSLSECGIALVCNHISNGGNILVENNAPGCNTEIEVTDSCGLNLNQISGIVQFDFDNDGCDNGDYDLTNVLIQASNGTNTITTTIDQNGGYNVFVPWEGLVTIAIVPESISEFFQVSPESFETNFTGFGNEITSDFCLTATEAIDDLKITLIPINAARPGFDSSYKIIYENIGTTLLSGSVSLTYDTGRQDYLNSVPVQDAINGNSISWDYTNLVPFESRVITVNFNNDPPPINEDGDILTFEALITPITSDDFPDNNSYILEQVMINSQDPNDKIVNQGEEIFESEIGAYLDYVIRFQNVGTASAINVRVDDILDPNLDWDTFRLLDASHEYQLEIMDGNQVSFIFDGINLPSVNTDPEGSQGYIAFQIRSLEILAVGDMIENEANIFFDFNAPILTNTVTTTVVDNLGVDTFDVSSHVVLYPNPVSEELQINIDGQLEYVNATVYSILGEHLHHTSEEKINMSELTAGIYFVEILTSEGAITKKVVKE